MSTLKKYTYQQEKNTIHFHIDVEDEKSCVIDVSGADLKNNDVWLVIFDTYLKYIDNMARRRVHYTPEDGIYSWSLANHITPRVESSKIRYQFDKLVKMGFLTTVKNHVNGIMYKCIFKAYLLNKAIDENGEEYELIERGN